MPVVRTLTQARTDADRVQEGGEMTNIKCMACGYDIREEGCKNHRVTTNKSYAEYIVVICGREGILLYKKQ